MAAEGRRTKGEFLSVRRWCASLVQAGRVFQFSAARPVVRARDQDLSLPTGNLIACSAAYRPSSTGQPAPKPKMEKTPEQVQKDIQDIMRQITSSVTFLPSLEEKCKSRLLRGHLILRAACLVRNEVASSKRRVLTSLYLFATQTFSQS